MADAIETKITVESIKKPAYVVYKARFYVLFVFSFLTFNQCTIWLTFSPIARNAEVYYNITDSTIDLLLNWGPIIFIPFLPLTSILLNRHDGLRHGIVLLAVADFIAALSRVLPLIIVSTSSPKFNSISLPFVHFGQILNAACGPLVMAPVSQLSCLWFAPHERTRATTIAIFANNFGATFGFVINPLVVKAPSHVPHLLYLHLGLAFIACVLTLLYFPSKPPTAPSAAAELLATDPDPAKNNHNWRTFLRDTWKCLTTPSFLLLALSCGLLNGTFGAWTGLYDIILKPEHYTEGQAGWFGFGSSIAGIFGAVVLSHIADQRRFQHALKALILISLIACLCAIVWFQLCVHSIFYDKHILSSTAATIGLSTALAGLFAGAATPLMYEALAEIMHPLPESLSASILVQLINIATLVFLFVAPNRDKLVNFLVLVVAAVCIIMAALARFTYTRRDEDERKRIEKERNHNGEENNATDDITRSIDETNYLANGTNHLNNDRTNPINNANHRIDDEIGE